MIAQTQYQKLKQGGFVSIKLNGGPRLSGFAAQDLEKPQLVRLDGMVQDDNGILVQFALRLQAQEIEAVESLSSSPLFTDQEGHETQMNAAFWPDMD